MGFNKVGERNAIILREPSEESKTTSDDDLPDDFFELNQKDIHLLYREMKESRYVFLL